MLVDRPQDALDEALALRALPVNRERRGVLHLEPDQRVDEVTQLAISLLDEGLVLEALQTHLDDRNSPVVDQSRDVAAERIGTPASSSWTDSSGASSSFGQQFVEHIQERPAGCLFLQVAARATQRVDQFAEDGEAVLADEVTQADGLEATGQAFRPGRSGQELAERLASPRPAVAAAMPPPPRRPSRYVTCQGLWQPDHGRRNGRSSRRCV